jgi:Glycosyltransferase family 28 N-terminal domain
MIDAMPAYVISEGEVLGGAQACNVRSEYMAGIAIRGETDLMRILIVTAGSRGDVAPFTGLGQRLQQAGHEVALAAHGCSPNSFVRPGCSIGGCLAILPSWPAHGWRHPHRRPRDRCLPRSSTG